MGGVTLRTLRGGALNQRVAEPHRSIHDVGQTMCPVRRDLHVADPRGSGLRPSVRCSSRSDGPSAPPSAAPAASQCRRGLWHRFMPTLAEENELVPAGVDSLVTRQVFTPNFTVF